MVLVDENATRDDIIDEMVEKDACSSEEHDLKGDESKQYMNSLSGIVDVQSSLERRSEGPVYDCIQSDSLPQEEKKPEQMSINQGKAQVQLCIRYLQHGDCPSGNKCCYAHFAGPKDVLLGRGRAYVIL